jgi:hypothetical protein
MNEFTADGAEFLRAAALWVSQALDSYDGAEPPSEAAGKDVYAGLTALLSRDVDAQSDGVEKALEGLRARGFVK